ncbi:hypothetical protein GIB67_022674 [Kingdonia uniflora]|uniref:Uncharacterized protein n=1 Tax=Kingdonia uniflora TaxID=39325 RepID=A0A7J7P8R6_9MAGN|nr:hypothetical protein GIB67_022674 [Kingdonia uniflora]
MSVLTRVWAPNMSDVMAACPVILRPCATMVEVFQLRFVESILEASSRILRPEEGVLLANTDGSSRGNPDRGRFGIVYWNDRGAVEAVMVKTIEITTSFMAECYGILNVAVKAFEKGWLMLKVSDACDWECPLDLKEAISSVCFAAPRCADLPELQQVQMLFASKYGREFIAAAAELMPDCGVNRQLIELLSIRAPSAEKKLKLLKEIAEEHEIDWDPSSSETEFFKPHEDLLNGPTQFTSGSKLPLPKEKHEELSYSAPIEPSDEKYNSDSGLDGLDFPEVPKLSVKPPAHIGSPPEMVPPPCPSPPASELNHESRNISDNVSNEVYLEPHPVSKRKEIQFLPFITPPSLSSASSSIGQSEPIPFLPRTKSEIKNAENEDLAYLLSGTRIVAKTEQKEDLVPSISTTKIEAKYEINEDFEDVLAAAHAAADSAERAAAAARAAASLAEVRISELIKRRTDNQVNPVAPHFDHQTSPVLDKESNWSSEAPNLEAHNVAFESPSPNNEDLEHKSSPRQPQRLASIDDDPYFSYPNLFTSQDSNLGSGMNNSRYSHDL